MNAGTIAADVAPVSPARERAANGLILLTVLVLIWAARPRKAAPYAPGAQRGGFRSQPFDEGCVARMAPHPHPMMQA